MNDELYDLIDGLMNEADEAVEFLELEDAIEFFEQMAADIGARLTGLLHDLRGR